MNVHPAARPESLTALTADLDMVVDRRTTEAFAQRLLRAADFSHYAILRFSREPVTRFSRQIVLTNISRDVVRDYERTMLSSGSTAIARARDAVLPFTWDRFDPPPRQSAAGGEDGRTVLGRIGINMGVSLPVGARDGTRGLLLLGGERPTPLPYETAFLNMLGNGLFDAFVAIENGENGAADYRLTGRERQCLVWTSAGKGPAEIAAILGLSEQAVGKHVAASARKLGTTNPMQAVAKAIRLRVIE